MNKKLKLFGLLALTLALGAGAAWGVGSDVISRTLAGTDSNTFLLGKEKAGAPSPDFNLITGNGKQVGDVLTNNDAAYTNLVLKINAADGNEIQLAPSAGGAAATAPVRHIWQQVAGSPLQIVVNADDNAGKVVIKASNGDNPLGAVPAGITPPDTLGALPYTYYTGGTVLENGILGVTNNNSLGQNWVGVVANRDAAKAPLFQVEGVDKVYLGVNDPSGAVTKQPFFLMYNPAPIGTFNPRDELTYVKVKADAVSTKLQGLWLIHGLDQRVYTSPVAGMTAPNPGIGAPDTPAAGAIADVNGFVRLIKEGKGSLFINGDTSLLQNGGALPALPYDAVDGAHHRGGTVVEAGVLQVDGGNASVRNDHFRGSLGKVWATFQGSASAMANPYDPVSYLEASVGNTYVLGTGGMPALYNPLFILNDAKVMVNRSQFFSDFNVAKAATFHVDEYTLAGANYNPQVAVTLDGNDSKADGLLEGKFDLVLASSTVVNPNLPAVALRPRNTHSQSGAIGNDGQAIFFINNPENKIFASGDTLVANGILEIAGNKSIGGGQVTVGATGDVGLPNRGFLTPDLATFAASKTFKLENVAVGQARGAVAVERGETLSFKDITLENRGVTPGAANPDAFRINPGDVALGAGYNTGIVGDLFDLGVAGLGLLPGNWTDTATVAFGAAGSADAKYSVAGVLRNPTQVDVERGVWQLNALPVPTAAQVAAGDDPFMHVYVWPTAVLSLAKDVNDFSKNMDLKVTDDSRIRVVLRDSDIAATRGEAMAKAPVFQAHHIDYTALGSGTQNKDRRLNIQLDPTQLTGSTIKKGWVKLVFSPDARNWNHLHYLREYTPGLTYEDYAKVRITWTTTSDIVKNAVAHVDQNSYTILVEVGADVDDPINPGTPPAVEKDLKADVKAPAEVKVGSMVTFELGKWTYTKVSGDVEVQDVKWMLDGVDKTADVVADKLTVKAEKEGTMNLVVTSKLKSDPTVDGEAKVSVTVKKDGGSTSGGSSGGCDAGFAGLALLLAAPLFLRKRD